jgi:hypothetical protein
MSDSPGASDGERDPRARGGNEVAEVTSLALSDRQRAELFELFCTQQSDEPRDDVDVAASKLGDEYQLVMTRGDFADDAWKGVITYLVAGGWTLRDPSGTEIKQADVDDAIWGGPAPVEPSAFEGER